MASNPQHEPTMEEILASIRKIISEDTPEAAPAAAAEPVAETVPPPVAEPVAAAEPEPAHEEPAHEEPDVLELTQEVPHEEPEPVKPEPVFQAPAPKEPEDDVVFQQAEEPAHAASDHDDIFSAKTRDAIHDTFSNIQPQAAEVKSIPAPAQVAPAFSTARTGSSVEAVFERAISEAFDPVLHQWMDANKADLMTAVKPLIREWMDEHFPALLEGAVRNEVERVVKARGR